MGDEQGSRDDDADVVVVIEEVSEVDGYPVVPSVPSPGYGGPISGGPYKVRGEPPQDGAPAYLDSEPTEPPPARGDTR